MDLVLGPMFSGKTEELIRRVRRQQFAKRKCCVVGPKRDNRYELSASHVVTHNQHTFPCHRFEALSEAENVVAQAEVIGIDEAQFFPADLVECVRRWLAQGKILIVAMLSGDFERKPFGDLVHHLIPLAHKIIHLRAVCYSCGSDAPHTMRLEGESQQTQVLVGGADKYRAVCDACSPPLGEAKKHVALPYAAGTDESLGKRRRRPRGKKGPHKESLAPSKGTVESRQEALKSIDGFLFYSLWAAAVTLLSVLVLHTDWLQRPTGPAQGYMYVTFTAGFMFFLDWFLWKWDIPKALEPILLWRREVPKTVELMPIVPALLGVVTVFSAATLWSGASRYL